VIDVSRRNDGGEREPTRLSFKLTMADQFSVRSIPAHNVRGEV
jgi:hypothetical protein